MAKDKTIQIDLEEAESSGSRACSDKVKTADIAGARVIDTGASMVGQVVGRAGIGSPADMRRAREAEGVRATLEIRAQRDALTRVVDTVLLHAVRTHLQGTLELLDMYLERNGVGGKLPEQKAVSEHVASTMEGEIP